jgi:C4-dicarboxylate-specific signal transduction histidine kinase
MATETPGVRLSLDLDDPQGIPYFLWDEPMTLSELRARLQSANRAERLRLLGRILREARDTDVWRFTTTGEVAASWSELQRYLGRRRAFWQFLLERWRDLGLNGRS